MQIFISSSLCSSYTRAAAVTDACMHGRTAIFIYINAAIYIYIYVYVYTYICSQCAQITHIQLSRLGLWLIVVLAALFQASLALSRPLVFGHHEASGGAAANMADDHQQAAMHTMNLAWVRDHDYDDAARSRRIISHERKGPASSPLRGVSFMILFR